MPEVELKEELEVDRVILWRKQWLLDAGFSKFGADLIATATEIDYRSAIIILESVKRKGYDEDFALKFIL